MMREVKFRAWDGEKMYRSYTIDENGEMCTDGDFINEVEGKKGVIHMQYTGLLDKHGTEIYEGDIILVEGLQYTFEDIRTASTLRPYCDDNKVEVINNIYENPEKKEG